MKTEDTAEPVVVTMTRDEALTYQRDAIARRDGIIGALNDLLGRMTKEAEELEQEMADLRKELMGTQAELTKARLKLDDVARERMGLQKQVGAAELYRVDAPNGFVVDKPPGLIVAGRLAPTPEGEDR